MSVGARGHKGMETGAQEYGKGVQGESSARARRRGSDVKMRRGGWRVGVFQVKKMRVVEYMILLVC